MAHLLIVDDDWTNLETMDKACQFLGHQAQLCDAGSRVCQIAAASQPDLILLDMRMTDVDGIGVMQCLRHNPATMAIPVVFITAGLEEEESELVKAAGAKEYLSKPVSLATLQAVIQKYTS